MSIPSSFTSLLCIVISSCFSITFFVHMAVWFLILTLLYLPILREFHTCTQCILILLLPSSPQVLLGLFDTLQNSCLLFSTHIFMGIGAFMEHRQPARCSTFEKMFLCSQQLLTANTPSYRRDSRSLCLINAQMMRQMIDWLDHEQPFLLWVCQWHSHVVSRTLYFYSGGLQLLSLSTPSSRMSSEPWRKEVIQMFIKLSTF